MSTPLPVGIPTVKVTAQYRGPGGKGLRGTVTFTGPGLLTFSDSDLFIAGPVVGKLDDLGRLCDEDGNVGVLLPATDAPGMNPTGWAWTVKENLTGVTGSRTYALLLPSGTGPIDLADVAPADPSTPNYVPVPGPPGIVTSVNGKSASSITLNSSDVNALSRFADTARADISKPAVDVFNQKSMTYASVVQEVAVDYVNGFIYATQIIGDMVQLAGESAPVPYADRDTNGDICINKLTMTGTVVSAMHVKGAGHGGSLGVEYGRDGLVWLWIDRDASGSGFARSLSRIQFAAGTILDSRSTTSYAPLTGMHGVSCKVDSFNRRLMVRHTFPDPSDTSRRFLVYDLDEAVAQRWVALGSFYQDANQDPPTLAGPAVGTFQGHAIFGNYVYTLDGLGSSDTTYLTTLDWTTGKQIQRVKVTAHPEFTYREPEGVAIHIPDLGSPHRWQLLYGFANGGSGARTYTLSAIDVYSPPARMGINLNAGETPQAHVDIVAASGIPGIHVRGNGGAFISQWTNSGASTPATWISSGGHIATIKNGYFNGDGIQVGAVTTNFAGGQGGMIGITNTPTPPTSTPSGGAVIYASSGGVRVRGTGPMYVDSTGVEHSLSAATCPIPADHGLLAWSLDPAGANSQTSPTSGQIQLVRVAVRANRTLSSVLIYLNNAGAGLTSGQNFVGLYNMAGTRLAVSADQTTAWGTAGEKTCAFVTPVAVTPGNYWVAILSVGTTTPTITRASGQGGNMGIPTAETRFGTFGTAQTSLPSSITPASVGQAAVAYVVGLK